MTRGVFITGTDTGIGKTEVAASLIAAAAKARLKVVGMKPVASGADPTPEGLRNADALALMAAANLKKLYTEVNPYCFAPPIAPHIAALEAGVEIGLEPIQRAYAGLCQGADAVVVEGVGGWQVPLSPVLDLPDLARALELPVVLVVGLRLGCLNHALLTARAIRADGLELAGWVANEIDSGFLRPEANLATLEAELGAPLLARLAHRPGVSARFAGPLAPAAERLFAA